MKKFLLLMLALLMLVWLPACEKDDVEKDDADQSDEQESMDADDDATTVDDGTDLFDLESPITLPEDVFE